MCFLKDVRIWSSAATSLTNPSLEVFTHQQCCGNRATLAAPIPRISVQDRGGSGILRLPFLGTPQLSRAAGPGCRALQVAELLQC